MTTINNNIEEKLFCFEHQAMATTFSLSFFHEDKEQANFIANRCFQQLDTLELILSRFVPDSDVSRINKMEENDELILENETYSCLYRAIEISQITDGFFDVGMAEFTDIMRGYRKGILNSTEYRNALKKAHEEKKLSSIYIDPEHPRVYCIKKGINIDLGGIGKGFALDELGRLLKSFGIENYSLDSGNSTVLVKNDKAQKPFWSYTITNDQQEKELRLNDIAVSASGFYWNDRHIFNPLTGSNLYHPEFERIWVGAQEAVYADAFSTAFFIMPLSKISKIASETSHIKWVIYSKDGILKTITKND